MLLSHGFSHFLFAEEDLQEAELSLELFVLLVLQLHGRAVFFLADPVTNTSKTGTALWVISEKLVVQTSATFTHLPV